MKYKEIRLKEFTSDKDWRIRKWEDEEWHEPTADYMGLED